jgi:hypothetical protein
MIILVVAALTHLFDGNKNASTTISDNYGQYDEGSAMCDKGAYGDVLNQVNLLDEA